MESTNQNLPEAPASTTPEAAPAAAQVVVKVKKPKAPKEPKVKPPVDKRNGIVRPGAGTKTGRVWEICDQIARDTQAPAKRADVINAAIKEGLGAGTASTQFGRWCLYWGQKNEHARKPLEPKEVGNAHSVGKGEKSGKKNLSAAEGNAELGKVKVESAEGDADSPDDLADFMGTHEVAN